MAILAIERLINAPKNVVWRIISDVEGYADYAPNLSKTVILAGEGQNMTRQCWDTNGGTWKEQCVLWEAGRAYAMKVDTSDYPYPFNYVKGTWSLEEHEGGTLVKMRFDYEMKYGIVGRVANDLLLKRQFTKIADELMDNWETAMLKQATTA